MIKNFAIALAIGLGLSAVPALADDERRGDVGDHEPGIQQDMDRNDVSDDADRDTYDRDEVEDRDVEGRDEPGFLDRMKEKGRGVFGERGTKKAELDEGVLNLSTEDVQRIKARLTERGYAFEKVEGETDRNFDDVIEKFQRDTGIEESGELDLATLNALGFGAIVAIHPDVKGSELAQVQVPGATERPAGMPLDAKVIGGGKDVIGFILLGTSQIEAIQDRLADDGYYQGEKNGAVTSELLDGIKRFQQAKSIQPMNGVLDLATLAWFPDAKIDVELTEQPETEVSEPRVPGLNKGPQPMPEQGQQPERRQPVETPEGNR